MPLHQPRRCPPRRALKRRHISLVDRHIPDSRARRTGERTAGPRSVKLNLDARGRSASPARAPAPAQPPSPKYPISASARARHLSGCRARAVRGARLGSFSPNSRGGREKGAEAHAPSLHASPLMRKAEERACASGRGSLQTKFKLPGARGLAWESSRRPSRPTSGALGVLKHVSARACPVAACEGVSHRRVVFAGAWWFAGSFVCLPF